MATQVVTETAAPRRIETTLLVVQGFKDASGMEWRSGDRAPLHNREFRRLVRAHPEWFRMEHETAGVDLEWLDELDSRHEANYQAAKRVRDQEEARGKRALREELEAQGHPSSSQKQLERRYEKQERERVEQEKAAREEVARQRLEATLAVADMREGFHFNHDSGGDTP